MGENWAGAELFDQYVGGGAAGAVRGETGNPAESPAQPLPSHAAQKPGLGRHKNSVRTTKALS